MESSGFVVLLDAQRLPDLRRIFAVLARVPATGPKYIRELLAAHVKSTGKVRCAASIGTKSGVAMVFMLMYVIVSLAVEWD